MITYVCIHVAISYTFAQACHVQTTVEHVCKPESFIVCCAAPRKMWQALSFSR